MGAWGHVGDCFLKGSVSILECLCGELSWEMYEVEMIKR